MSGTTPKGWPYVTPDDHPLEFPTHSQALANMLEARVPYVVHTQVGNTDAGGVLNVTWPAALLGKVPTVVATAFTPNAAVSVQLTALTAAGATFNVYRISPFAGYAATVHVVAIVPR